MACLAPWAFGAVEAWAKLVLVVGAVVLALLRVPQEWGRGRRIGLTCVPSLALAGLLVLALVQAAPWPSGVLGWLAPGQARMRAFALPAKPERVAGDTLAPVPLPISSVSANREATLQMAAGLACAWIIFQSVLTLGGGFATYRRFAFILTANATLLALFSIIQRLAWNGKIYWIREAPAGSAGPFVDHNNLAAYLNVGLGLALGFFFAPSGGGSRRDQGRHGVRLWAGYAAGLIIVGIIVSLSRSGFLGMTVALLVAAFFVPKNDGKRLAGGLGVVLLLALLFFAALGGTLPYQERLGTLLGKDPYSYRFRVWTGGLRAWPQAPFFGSGLGTFATAAARFFPFDAGETYFHAENEYIEWLVEGGLVGLGLVLATAAGTAALGWRALRAAPTPERRALILGGLFGVVSLAVHSGGDFALHIPGVTIAVVALAAHLARLGLRASTPDQAPRALRFGWAAGRVPWVTCAVALGSVALLAPAFRQARAEALLSSAGMPLEGAISQRFDPEETEDGAGLELARVRLEEALKDRPDWAEGYLGLGLVLVRLYEQSAMEALAREVDNPVLLARFSRPLWLSVRVRTADPEERLSPEALLALDAVREYLVPAARCFLQARRCDLVRPLPHTKLATLSFLLEGADPGRVYLERALRLSAGSGLETARVGEVALPWGEMDLAARCWRRELVLGTRPWVGVADASIGFLSPEEILRDVVPDGPLAVRFAQRLFTGQEAEASRRLYAEEALRRLGQTRVLPDADRLEFTAEAYQLLDDREKARAQIQAALALKPERSDWRKTFVRWLIAWGRLEEAHGQARVAVAVTPGNADAKEALELAADALARSSDESSRAEEGKNSLGGRRGAGRGGP